MPANVIDASEFYHRREIERGVVLDPTDKDNFNKIIGQEDMHKHQYILASSGAGKTECLKLLFRHQALELKCSIVIVDIQGDLANQSAMMFNKKKDIVYIDLSLQKGLTATINPFRLKKIDEETIAIVSQEILNALESIIGADFTPNMEALLIPCIYILLRKGNSGLDELQKFMDDDNNKDLIALGTKSPIQSHSNFFKNQFSKSKFTTTKNAIETKLQLLLNNPIFSDFITGDSTINLEKEVDTIGKIIILKLPKDRMRKALTPAAKFFIAMIQGIVLKRANLPQATRPRTYLILDEFQNFYSNTLKEMLTESRKNNLTLLCVHQVLSQIDTSMRDTIMTNSYIKIVGKNSAKDLKVMADEIDVDIESLKQLRVGEFYVKVGSKPAIKIITTDKFIGDKYNITDTKWKQHLKYQKKKYYKKVIYTTGAESIYNTVDDSNSTLPIPKYDTGE